jgi:hypothetical protein
VNERFASRWSKWLVISMWIAGLVLAVLLLVLVAMPNMDIAGNRSSPPSMVGLRTH